MVTVVDEKSWPSVEFFFEESADTLLDYGSVLWSDLDGCWS